MRVRPLRHPAQRRSPASRRPLHIVETPSPVLSEDPERRAERRVRASGGPQDTAHYSCSCGYQFEASVSTSVACPHCGTTQAW